MVYNTEDDALISLLVMYIQLYTETKLDIHISNEIFICNWLPAIVLNINMLFTMSYTLPAHRHNIYIS